MRNGVLNARPGYADGAQLTFSETKPALAAPAQADPPASNTFATALHAQ